MRFLADESVDRPILLLRIADLTEAAMCAVVSRTVTDYGEQLPNSFTVLTPDSLRIRRPVPWE